MRGRAPALLAAPPTDPAGSSSDGEVCLEVDRARRVLVREDIEIRRPTTLDRATLGVAHPFPRRW